MIMDKKAMTWHTLLIIAITMISVILIMFFIWGVTGNAPPIVEAFFRIFQNALLGG